MLNIFIGENNFSVGVVETVRAYSSQFFFNISKISEKNYQNHKLYRGMDVFRVKTLVPTHSVKLYTKMLNLRERYLLRK